MLRKALVLSVALVLSLLSMGWDNGSTPPVEYPNAPPQAGWTWFGGLVQREECANATFFIYADDEELLGEAQAETDIYDAVTYFYTYLSRPFEESETIIVHAKCARGLVVHDTFIVAPFQFWPSAIYLRHGPRCCNIPGTYPTRPLAGATSFEGRLHEFCAGRVVYLYLGTGPDGKLLGSGLANADGYFHIKLEHPLEADSVITVYSDCSISENVPIGEYLYVWDTLMVPPPLIPEPMTLLLVGPGLGLLALYITSHRRKR